MAIPWADDLRSIISNSLDMEEEKISRKRICMGLEKGSCLQEVDSTDQHINSQENNRNNDVPNFMDDADNAYIVLLNIFSFLSLKDLLSAACVSKVWNLVASDRIFWKTVKLKNCEVLDYSIFKQTLIKNGTQMLDLREINLPSQELDEEGKWEKLCMALKDVKTLTKINMDHCPGSAVTMISKVAPQVKSLISCGITGDSLDLSPFSNMKNLAELKLKGVGSKVFTSATSANNLEMSHYDFQLFKTLTNLTTLTLSKVSNLNCFVQYLPPNLLSLWLGECTNLSKSFATKVLPKLVNLKRLRLENGSRTCPTIAILNTISTLPELKELELINFDIITNFNCALGKCHNLRSLLIIPHYEYNNYRSQSVINAKIINGIGKLKNSLNSLVWGIPLESIQRSNVRRNREKEIRVCIEENGVIIPIYFKKPKIPGFKICIMSLSVLQKNLLIKLSEPTCKVIIVPFMGNWEQSLFFGLKENH